MLLAAVGEDRQASPRTSKESICMTNGINGINGTNGINGCFIPPSAQGRAKSPCVGADFISARKVRVIAGTSALGGPYTQPYVGRRGEHCSPVAMGGGVKSLGRALLAPTHHSEIFPGL